MSQTDNPPPEQKVSAEENNVSDLVKELLPPMLFMYYLSCIKLPDWEKYANSKPSLVKNIKDFMNMEVLEPQWQEIFKFIAFLEAEVTVRYIRNKKEFLKTGYYVHVKDIWDNAQPEDNVFLYTNEVINALNGLLESHIFRKILMPSKYRVYILSENWEILIRREVVNQDIEVLSAQSIKMVLDWDNNNTKDPLNTLLRQKMKDGGYITPKVSKLIN